VHLDLNLLTALDVLLEERSVGAAAQRLHLSQPAMSRTLGRIRRATGDQILVRSGRSMLPTAYAEQIRGEVHQLVTRAQAIFTPSTELDLSTLDRTFTLQCNDVVASALVPRLTARVASTAPGVCLRVLGESDSDVDELRRGSVDLRITDQTTHPADVRSQTVMTDTLAVIARRKGDPFARPHVAISRRGRQRSRLDDLLEEHGLRRRVVLTVPTLAMALQAIATADLVTIAPRTLTQGQLTAGLKAFPLPLPTPEIPAVLAWHTRHDPDTAHHWLRSLIVETLTSVA